MIKNVLLGLVTVVALTSSVGMVSAFEAHLINVEAHVENAIRVTGNSKVNYMTVFPQEFLIEDRLIGLSQSFSEIDPIQDRVLFVTYDVFVGPTPGAPCLGDAMYIGIQDLAPDAVGGDEDIDLHAEPAGDLVAVGSCDLVKVASDSLDKTDIQAPLGETPWVYKQHDDRLYIAIDVPVFEAFYNELTDVIGCIEPGEAEYDFDLAKPSGLCAPTVVIKDPFGANENDIDTARYDPDGDLGFVLKAEIIIQVTCVGNETFEGSGICVPFPP